MSHIGTVTVLVVNPNTNRVTTTMMTDLARQHLGPAGVAVEGVTVDHGPSMIVDPASLTASVAHVVAAVQRRLAEPTSVPIDAVIVAAIGDPGREELAASCEIPVVGIGQAAILAAASNGRRFGMATTTPLLAHSLTSLVQEHAKSGSFTGVQFTPSDPLLLGANPEQQYQELAQAVIACAQEDKAEAVIIAGGPLSQTARRLAALGLVDIVEPVPSASQLVLDKLKSRRSKCMPAAASTRRPKMA